MTITAGPQAIAQATLDGFNRHYALFLDCARMAKRHFEAGNWLANFFIPVRIEQYAEKTPTPLKVMHDLTEPAEMFQFDVDDAKRMMRFMGSPGS